MKIVLIRHAKAYESTEDPKRNLTEEGKKEAEKIAKLLKKTNWNFTEILTSPILRAYQTAEIINEQLQISIKQRKELEPNQAFFQLENHIYNYDPNDSIIFIVHMPDVAQIASKILKIPVDNLFFSTGSAMGINLSNLKPLQGILIFHYQPNFL